MDSDIAIQVDNLSKCYQIYDKPHQRLLQMVYRGHRQYYREFWALKDVSFTVKRGETLGIIGRNGSGKSTLLQLICGTLTATSGTVHTNGRVAALLELGAGFNPEFTGRENIYMNASILGLSHDEIDARFDAIVAFADIGDFIKQPVKSYSSGMYVRLAFAVIAHVDADILVIDEALAVGDAFFTQKCMRFLRKFMKYGTILFVSHDTGSVVNLCDQAILLERGIVKENGLPKDVAQLYLAKLYESVQGKKDFNIENFQSHEQGIKIVRKTRDMRLEFINSTKFRNDIELFEFDPTAASFGKGGGTINLVELLDENHIPLNWVVGGETVILHIKFVAHILIKNPIIGFIVKDKLGQSLFGDNTYNFSIDKIYILDKNQHADVKFTFNMPILPKGQYSITVALAEGTQENHIQHQWIHDALIMHSHSTSVSTGLIGIPINKIEINHD